MHDLEGLAAVVTGGASGIGAATARRLRREGAAVAVLDRHPASAGDLRAYACDVTDAAEVDAAIAAAAHDLGGIDILVNNAGIGATGDVAANDDEEWRHVFDVNVFGIVRTSRAALPHLRRSDRAAIVNTSSIVAAVGVPQRALYSATKGAVSALTLAMAADHIADGIRVNAVLPGTASTPWVQRLLAESGDADAAAEQLRRRQPMGRLVSADEIAAAIVYLASPDAASTTGTLLTVDGGMGSLRMPATA
jgi:2-keto-3-deoxy-L-fuconate dehydrogenase